MAIHLDHQAKLSTWVHVWTCLLTTLWVLGHPGWITAQSNPSSTAVIETWGGVKRTQPKFPTIRTSNPMKQQGRITELTPTAAHTPSMRPTQPIPPLPWMAPKQSLLDRSEASPKRPVATISARPPFPESLSASPPSIPLGLSTTEMKNSSANPGLAAKPIVASEVSKTTNRLGPIQASRVAPSPLQPQAGATETHTDAQVSKTKTAASVQSGREDAKRIDLHFSTDQIWQLIGLLVTIPTVVVVALVLLLRWFGALGASVIRVEVQGDGGMPKIPSVPPFPKLIDSSEPIPFEPAIDTAPSALVGLEPDVDYQAPSFELGPTLEEERALQEQNEQQQAEAILRNIFEQNSQILSELQGTIVFGREELAEAEEVQDWITQISEPIELTPKHENNKYA